MGTTKLNSKRILMVIMGAVVISSFFLPETLNFQRVQSNSFEDIPDDLQNNSPKASEDNVIHIDGRLSDNLSSYYPFLNGSGTLSDPYTLANMHINSSLSGDIIYIEYVVDYFHITNMTVISTAFGGASIRVDNCVNISIFNNHLSAQMHGISLAFCSNILVDNNSFTNSPFHGLFLIYCNQMLISNNQISSQYTGITIFDGENIKIISNNLDNNDRTAINIQKSTTISIIDNTFINNENGIISYYTEVSLIDQNIFDFNKKIAIGLYSSNDNNISSNIISNSRYGVSFGLLLVGPDGRLNPISNIGMSVKNILYNNTLTDISIKPIKFWLGQNEAIDNHFEQNPWSAILIFLICCATISLITIPPYFLIKKRAEFKRKIKAYEGAVDQKDKIEALEKELEEFKQKYFELKENLK